MKIIKIFQFFFLMKLMQCFHADVIVVSEETGGISLVRGGQITPIESINTLNLLLGEKTE